MATHIVWDFDGTLFDTYPAVADVFIEVLAGFCISADRDEVLGLLHKSLADTYDFFSARHSIDCETLRTRFIETEEAMDVSLALPFPGAREILSLVIGNGGLNLIYTNRGGSTYKFLAYSGFSQYFREVVTREDGFGRKPSPDCINYFLEKYSLDKNEVIMVGDREIDMLAAINAGIKTCYFDSHGLPVDMETDIRINSLYELEEYLFPCPDPNPSA
ncbi:MAG: HAD-IA family hydrolase [Clostridia bacterium]|nr:HAD-IA family hydrolase [Clostridia bacterium]